MWTKRQRQRILNELYATKLRLQTIMRQKTKGSILKSQALWHELGERNSRYFFNLERRNQFKKKQLRNSKVTCDRFEILQEQKTVFESLYKWLTYVLETDFQGYINDKHQYQLCTRGRG